MKVVKIINDDIDIVYSYIKAPLMISDRDWLQKRFKFDNIEDFEHMIAFENHENDEFPHKKGVVRAESLVSAYIFRRVEEKKTRLTIIT